MQLIMQLIVLWGLNQRNADERSKICRTIPTSTKRNSAFIDVADYYFEGGNHRQAVQWYDKVEEKNLSADQKKRYYFNKGYTLCR
jgi:hypothetical protein